MKANKQLRAKALVSRIDTLYSQLPNRIVSAKTPKEKVQIILHSSILINRKTKLIDNFLR
jgi:hypothetical protein